MSKIQIMLKFLDMSKICLIIEKQNPWNLLTNVKPKLIFLYMTDLDVLKYKHYSHIWACPKSDYNLQVRLEQCRNQTKKNNDSG